MKIVKTLAALLCLLALLLPASASETSRESATLPPLVVGVRTISEIPASWNPLQERTASRNAILELTSQPLYQLFQGAVIPAQADDLPQDVTAEFAGRYRIPQDASNGYAYAISIREGLNWENGKELTLADWMYTIEKQLEMNVFPLEIANYQAYLRGETAPAEEVISLMDAGYDSVEAAQRDGIFDFYVETTVFWGLDTGWRRSTDRTKLFDAAIPSGCEEMYVTPAYLYREYLGVNGSQTMFQSEFVGIPAKSGAKMTMEDVGIVLEEDRLVLVFQEPVTTNHLALALTDIYPIPQGADGAAYGTAANYMACGPYRIDSVTKDQILLTPNPYWTGAAASFEQVCCREAS